MEWWYPIGPILFFTAPVWVFVGWVIILHLESGRK